jgi:hypothetical protein
LAASASWIEIWTWSSPAAASASTLASSSSTAAVIRLVYWPASAARRIKAGRSGRSVGSPPEKWVCSTPSAPASSITRSQVAVSSSAAARSSASGLEQYGHCSGQRWVSSASSVIGGGIPAAPAWCVLIALDWRSEPAGGRAAARGSAPPGNSAT